MLYLVSTPIGNLEDITYRAVRILSEVDYILCEDTRQSHKLMQHYDIKPSFKVYHAQNHQKVGKSILEDLKNGKNIALISDAGTPLINDPGILLVKEAIELGIEVVSVPGASAVLTALVASGLDTNHFTFLGFIPHKKGRQTLWKRIAAMDHTVVMYESCHRIEKTLDAFVEYIPERQIVVAREMTKKFEEFVRGTSEEVKEYFADNPTKGEFVVMVGR